MNVYYGVVSGEGLYLPTDTQFRYTGHFSTPAFLFRESALWTTHLDNGHVTRTKDGWIYGSDWMLEWDSSDLQRPVLGKCGYWLDGQTGTKVTARPIDWNYLKLRHIFRIGGE